MSAIDAMLKRAIGGRGGVVGVIGHPGIGKSRLLRVATEALEGHLTWADATA
jgi:predicted ATPase